MAGQWTYYSLIVYISQREPQWIILLALLTPVCSFHKVLNQRVDWVAWASIQFYGTHDAINDVCTTSSALLVQENVT